MWCCHYNVATTFARGDDYALADGERNYIRDKGLNQEHAEAVICRLEAGAAALTFSSGIAACTAPSMRWRMVIMSRCPIRFIMAC